MNEKFEIGNATLYNGDALEILPALDVTVDAVISDPPYGVTSHAWDQAPPFDTMWQLFEAKTKQNANYVMFCCGGFTIDLINSKRRWFRYDLVWAKNNKTGFLNANLIPLRNHENILVFGRPGFQKTATYNMIGDVHPSSIIVAKRDAKRPEECLHPTQKPELLMCYLIKMYSNENDVILDPFSGSCTTGVAALRMNRRFIGIEREKKYFDIACERLEEAQRRKERYKPRRTCADNSADADQALAEEESTVPPAPEVNREDTESMGER